MNSKIKEYINQLKYLVIKGNSVDALQRIDDIEKILSNSVIISKDKLQFEFTEFKESLNLNHIVCQISCPKETYTYDSRNKFIQENKEEIMKWVKEELKKKLIECWGVSEDE